ncbi:hypothetical protein C8J57DRAFT_267752 [Mycena rebaudengoi]|nr:hypothetical protein C8J57DRAFT_267752 [Mycena rebaudengoi]
MRLLSLSSVSDPCNLKPGGYRFNFRTSRSLSDEYPEARRFGCSIYSASGRLVGSGRGKESKECDAARPNATFATGDSEPVKTVNDAKENVDGNEEGGHSGANNEEAPDEKLEEPPLNPHMPPQWLLDSRPEARFIFRRWPRDPNGPWITTKKLPQGKETPNGLPWGATLYDFFSHGQAFGIVSFSTGGCLARKMREIGELDAAAAEIAWADEEPDPEQLVLPDDIEQDVKAMEDLVASGLCGRSVRTARAQEKVGVVVELPQHTDQHCDIYSIQPVNYPPSWPLIPFSCLKPPIPKLETLIPLTLLPKKLIVHDPWNLLSMPDEFEGNENTEWKQMLDITHTYKLNPLTEAGLQKDEHQQDVFRHSINDSDFLILTDGSKDSSSTLLRTKIPAYPHKSITPAAHLYLSPAHKADNSHHSAVYNAEWELPRSLLVRDIFCRECVVDELDSMHASAELADLIRDTLAELGDDTESATHVTLDSLEAVPEAVIDVAELASLNLRGDTEKAQTVSPKLGNVEMTRKYRGPIIDYYTKVPWQTPGHGPNCKHISGRPSFHPLLGMIPADDARPPTATVRVCAKFSIQHDEHLAREAKVYQAFPSHLSEHWSGYNLVPPSRNPVPVGAVVPQFYGYYTPENEDAERYLSPIMLLENCGRPLDLKQMILTNDHKSECSSLLYRLNHAGWLHESVATRNLVVQLGPLTVPQGWMRCDGISFRVIDFGRSLYCGDLPEDKDTEDVFRELRGEGDSHERLRDERREIDELLSQGLYKAR